MWKVFKDIVSVFACGTAANAMSPNCGMSANVLVEHKRGSKTLRKQAIKNIVVNGGLDWLAALVGNDTGAGGAKFITLSSDTDAPIASQTDLGADIFTQYGLERAEGTYANVAGTGNFTIANTFTCTEDAQTVGSVGLSYADDTASLLAGVAITPATLQNLDTLSVTWTVTFTSVDV